MSARPSAEELEETRELVRWFRRRHPTPLERLAYVRRAYARWTNGLPHRDDGGRFLDCSRDGTCQDLESEKSEQKT